MITLHSINLRYTIDPCFAAINVRGTNGCRAMIITVLLIRAYARMARNKDAERIYNDYVRYKERHNKEK